MRIVVLTDIHMRQPSATELDEAFAPYSGAVVFYGHHHPFSDKTGRARYITPGSLGCAPSAVARYTLVDVDKEQWRINHCSVPYGAIPFQAFEQRRVPERAFLFQAFFGGRFHD